MLSELLTESRVGHRGCQLDDTIEEIFRHTAFIRILKFSEFLGVVFEFFAKLK